jgi:hypothetical protein
LGEGEERSKVTNAKGSSRPSDNRNNNRYNQNITDRDKSTDRRNTGSSLGSGSSERRSMNSNGNNKGPIEQKAPGMGYQGNRNNNTTKPYGYTNRENSTGRSSGDNRNSNQSRSSDNTFRGKDAGKFNHEKKPYRTFGKDSFRPGYNFNKDEDEENDKKFGKAKHQSRDIKGKTPQNKEKEPQPDKIETSKRLEKEKKVLERKNQEMEKEKQNKPSVKKRRTGNVNWTKGYTTGLYGDDDEEDYTEYF